MQGPLNVKPVVSVLWILVFPVGTYQDSIKFQGRSYWNDGPIGVHTVQRNVFVLTFLRDRHITLKMEATHLSVHKVHL
jgi:hypothetical protein